jgi:transcriptional regulator with XRE-family HTH domain
MYSLARTRSTGGSRVSDSPLLLRRLGQELRRLREAAGKTGESAGAVLDVHQSTISRIETGKRKLAEEELATLLDFYEAPDSERTEARALFKQTDRQPERVTVYSSSVPPWARRLMEVEGDVAEKWSYENELVPGLFQTEDYARALILASAGLYGMDRVEVERRVTGRMARQAILTGDHQPTVNVLLNEPALHRPVGGRAVARRQLLTLVEMSQRRNITIRVLPFDLGEHPILGYGLHLLRFRDEREPSMAYVEQGQSITYFEGVADIARYFEVIGHLTDVALGPDESRAWIIEMADTFR